MLILKRTSFLFGTHRLPSQCTWNVAGMALCGLFACSMLGGAAAAAQLPDEGARGTVDSGSSAKKVDSAASKQENEPEEETRKEEDAAEKRAELLAITGGDVITVTRETIRNGTVLIEDGKIKALGQDIKIPEAATVIDAQGKYICPGFVAVNMSRVGLEFSGEDKDAKYADGLDPFDRNIQLALAVGITTGCTEIRSSGRSRSRRAPEESFPVTERFPGLDPDLAALAGVKQQSERDYGEYVQVCKCCGLPILPTEPIERPTPTRIQPRKNVVIKMSYGKLEGMLVDDNVFLDMTPGSLTGALNRRNWRKQLEDAREYLKKQAEHERNSAQGKKGKPPRKPVSDQVLDLVQGKIGLRISAGTVAEMREMIELAKELDYRLVVENAGEAWVIPNELSEADVAVTITPRDRRDPRFGQEDRSGTWIETPRVLEASGVPFAISPLSSSISLVGLAGRDLTSLPLEAAFAVRGGASERKALEAITIAPARMMGLGDRIGSLEVGKDADLLVLNGPPLDYRTYVETAVVNGNMVYQREQARVLPIPQR